MNGKERILAAFKGKSVDYVPFAPNIYQWFYYHQVHNKLPAAVADAEHPFDVLRYLGADILARWDTQWATKTIYNDGKYSEEYSGDIEWDKQIVTAFNIYPPNTNKRVRKFETPYGTLSQTWSFFAEAGADMEEEYWWTDWEQYKAIRFMIEARDYVFDAGEFHTWVERAGDDGIVMLNLTESPLKMLHWLAGPQNATLFIIDHPEEMKALAKIHEEKILSMLEKEVDNADADVFVATDNLDSMFYPPYFYKDYCQDFFGKAAEIIHSRDKHLVVHACGRAKVLLPLVGETKVDCLEGVTPPPMGDVELGQVRQMTGYEQFTVNGGMDAMHQEIIENAEERLHDYTRTLFEAMGNKRHFIYASSCNTSPLTPWENLIHFRNAAREYGKLQ